MTEIRRGEQTEIRRVQLGAAAGGKLLGASLCELPPGKRSWPLHYHVANEEALFILAGRGTLRLGAEAITVEAGDYIALPPGPDHAHQLRNDGDVPLRYLCMSTMIGTDVVVYPDSGKVGVFGGAAPGGAKQDRHVEGFWRLDQRVDYWDGEDEAP